jgi:methylase of polypeptide subunit release factors
MEKSAVENRCKSMLGQKKIVKKSFDLEKVFPTTRDLICGNSPFLPACDGDLESTFKTIQATMLYIMHR